MTSPGPQPCRDPSDRSLSADWPLSEAAVCLAPGSLTRRSWHVATCPTKRPLTPLSVLLDSERNCLVDGGSVARPAPAPTACVSPESGQSSVRCT